MFRFAEIGLGGEVGCSLSVLDFRFLIREIPGLRDYTSAFGRHETKSLA